jgi:NAD(P)-dependent dehydrogenase (short-subunit alcohol dehydrogenase family)
MDEYSDDEFELVMRTNVYGTFNCMRAELAHMVPRGSGTIVNTSSAVTVLAVPGHAAYTASKAAVNGLTTAAAREYAGTGVRINAVMPGGVNTERGRAASRRQYGQLETAMEDYPLGRLAEPLEIAEAVLWLSSDRSSYVIGERVLVDGGFYSAHQHRPRDGSIKLRS